QHFALVRPFSAFENIVLGTDLNPTGERAKEAKASIADLAKGIDLQITLDSPVKSLALGAQQRVEILKMLYRNVDILILDEPTSSLTIKETGELFKSLLKLKEEGKCVIFITHKLKEMMKFCNNITNLKQKKNTKRINKSKPSPITLTTIMVERTVKFEPKRSPMTPKKKIFTIDNLTLLDKKKKKIVK